MGGSVEYQFVPILKLISTLLTMGVLASLDVHKILLLIEPNVFGEQREEAVGGGGSGGREKRKRPRVGKLSQYECPL